MGSSKDLRMQRALAILALLGVVGMAVPADASSKKPRTHQVYPGQTLGMIAKRYNVSFDAICTAIAPVRRATAP